MLSRMESTMRPGSVILRANPVYENASIPLAYLARDFFVCSDGELRCHNQF
jgi:hypothetical protein